MTLREMRKLETIIGRVESLQGTIKDASAKARLGEAKTILLRIISKNLD